MFSFIVSVYNIEEYIEKCLRSIQSQTYKDFEVIVVDDGSTDSSPSICDTFANNDSRFKVIHKKNGGPTSARKAGLHIARGDYVIVVDGDDYVDENYAESINLILEKERDIDMVLCNYRRVDSLGNVQQFVSNKKAGVYQGDELNHIVDSFLYDKDQEYPNSGSIPYSLCTKVVRAELIKFCQDISPNHIRYGEDALCSIFMLEKAKKIYISEICAYNYYVSTTSASLNFNADKIEKYNDTIVEFSKHIDEDRVAAFACFNLCDLLLILGRNCNSYKEYYNKVLQTYSCRELWEYTKKAKIDKCSFSDRIKIWLTKHQRIRLLYWASKYIVRK